MTVEQNPKRYLSLYERYSVSRRNIGFPSVIFFIVSYPTSSSLPSDAFLEDRIRKLQERLPLLNAEIRDYNTSKPYFAVRDEIRDPRDILFQTKYEPESSRQSEMEDIFIKEPLRLITKEDFYSGPSWQVRKHVHRSQNPAQAESSRAYLTLSIDHAFSDGQGSLSILRYLLAGDDETCQSIPHEPLERVTRYEDTINIKPSMRYLLPIIFDKLLVPKLPSFLQYYLRSAPTWPSSMIKNKSAEALPRQLLLFLPTELIDSLKYTAKQNGVKTLHGVLKAALLTSIWAIYGPTLIPFKVKGATPRSDRNSMELGHPICTGNYVSFPKIEITLEGKDNFWNVAKQCSDKLSAPETVRQGRMDIGTLAYIPEPEKEKTNPQFPTGWESFLSDQINSDSPFGDALNLSNLGKVDLPPRADDMVWGQRASPFAGAITCNVMSHKAGFRMIITWLEDSAVKEDEVLRLEKVFVGMLQRLIEAQEDTTLEALSRT
ncbi:uncharacterized protein I303_105441 [Kwoniella dejecticola CBS 10117]|uniref:Alcohol acetyltransferase n=1 Tax=Kwoniella dejecticola CBS 10117 TaxID=1296121 RepID=A0A1A6A2H7_9TREE|nr:uncharacterized protein I303_05118 [Kwoniella dejecticola CBS 10117]OBR84261.1 hypothetical protein I303_05118 [Kwoniella dejecticola CBS 10117]